MRRSSRSRTYDPAGTSAFAGHGARTRGEGGLARDGNPLDNAIRQNVIDNVAKLKSATPILNAPSSRQAESGGGIYRLATAGST